MRNEQPRDPGFPRAEEGEKPKYTKGKSTIRLEREIGDMIYRVERGDLNPPDPEKYYVKAHVQSDQVSGQQLNQQRQLDYAEQNHPGFCFYISNIFGIFVMMILQKI